MALLWQKRVGDCHYQVRSHGASVRLYSNGVFHSQWNPRDPLKGSLWELLLLPAFFRSEQQIRSVLLLGVGGGALIRLLQQFFTPTRIVGVDLDPTHLDIARRYFGVRNAELVCDDASNFVAGLVGGVEPDTFDLIIDDLFGHSAGEAERTVAADTSWCRKLLGLLSSDGVLVCNFGSRRELLASGWCDRCVRAQLHGGWTAELPAYENAVLAVSRQPLSLTDLAATAPDKINPANPSRRLDCRLRRLI
ncbi:Methyltransferase domain-containing protein [Microbulbifer donghaiensis]|uniref:Methyltransferase domain-containing protein n=1 Tax=Microbulbifer donghaiensis TaxID=494016 RepID=A0A1M5I9H4_9GAMM|nr:methyltransferase domain-containing protein [Microbulbifer donghaiensis]SHG24946.1 Methyltransferase domain-containing protein [Microbulbifer donghaiensis]